MYAVIDIGSFQFKVSEGDLIDAPKLDREIGQKFDVAEVLLVSDGDNVKVGNPYLKGASVSLEVISQHKDDKDIKFIYRKRKDWRKKQGHRQELTALKVAKISA
jgi:large subunit ribosomal protein L21